MTVLGNALAHFYIKSQSTIYWQRALLPWGEVWKKLSCRTVLSQRKTKKCSAVALLLHIFLQTLLIDVTWEGWHKQEGFVVDVSSLFSLTCLTEGDRKSPWSATGLLYFPQIIIWPTSIDYETNERCLLLPTIRRLPNLVPSPPWKLSWS